MPRIENVTKKFSSNFSLNVENLQWNSQIHFLIGPNGSGKSSLLKSLLEDATEFKNNAIFMPASSESVEGLRLFEILEIFEIDLPKSSEEFSSMLNQPLDSLSSGQQQRFLLYSYMNIKNREYVFLDEPTNFLDPNYKFELLDVIRESNKQFIIATHDLNWAIQFEDATGSILLNGKNIHLGPMKSLVESPEMQKAFQLSFQVEDNLDNRLKYLKVRR